MAIKLIPYDFYNKQIKKNVFIFDFFYSIPQIQMLVINWYIFRTFYFFNVYKYFMKLYLMRKSIS